MENKPFFTGTTPCKNCPYRKDAPTELWDRAEFKDLLDNDKSVFGSTYGCHKNDGTCCKGWLIDQDKRDFPSIALRINLSKEGIRRAYLDKLNCKTELYSSIEEMAKANFPDTF